MQYQNQILQTALEIIAKNQKKNGQIPNDSN